MNKNALILSLMCIVCISLQGCQAGSAKKSVRDARQITMTEHTYPVVIIGGGVGGLTAALYIALANVKPLLFEGEKRGGLLVQSPAVRNWPGEKEIAGHVLIDNMRDQIKEQGAHISSEKVVGVDFSVWPYQLEVEKRAEGEEAKRTTTVRRTITALSCIIATGTENRYLGIDGEATYWGRGVSNCAVCDGALYKGKKVGIVGGGDAAIVEAAYLSHLAESVTIIVRSDSLRARDKRKDEVLKRAHVSVCYNTEMRSIQGNEQGVTSVELYDKKTKKSRKVPMDGLFLAIGSDPNTSLFKNSLSVDTNGYLVVNPFFETSCRGVFAIGDVVDPRFKQAITAAGDGCKAALKLLDFLQEVHFEIKQQKTSATPPMAATVEQKRQESDHVIAIDSPASFTHNILKSELLTFIDFYATWCPPCKILSPLFEQLAQEYRGRIRCAKVNIDDMTESAREYDIRAIPTIIGLYQGTEIMRLQGLRSYEDLKAAVESGLQQTKK